MSAGASAARTVVVESGGDDCCSRRLGPPLIIVVERFVAAQAVGDMCNRGTGDRGGSRRLTRRGGTDTGRRESSRFFSGLGFTRSISRPRFEVA
jgi:hypothetical protein